MYLAVLCAGHVRVEGLVTGAGHLTQLTPVHLTKPVHRLGRRCRVTLLVLLHLLSLLLLVLLARTVLLERLQGRW